MLYVSKVNKKKKHVFVFVFFNNSKMPYVSEVIKNKGLEKKMIRLHTSQNHFTGWNLAKWIETSGMEWNRP